MLVLHPVVDACHEAQNGEEKRQNEKYERDYLLMTFGDSKFSTLVSQIKGPGFVPTSASIGAFVEKILLLWEYGVTMDCLTRPLFPNRDGDPKHGCCGDIQLGASPNKTPCTS
jgi:hypothetical protein